MTCREEIVEAFEKLAADGVQAMTADDFLVGLLRRRPTAVQEAFVATAAARRRPRMAACELIDRIDRAGTPKFATECESASAVADRRRSAPEG